MGCRFDLPILHLPAFYNLHRYPSGYCVLYHHPCFLLCSPIPIFSRLFDLDRLCTYGQALCGLPLDSVLRIPTTTRYPPTATYPLSWDLRLTLARLQLPNKFYYAFINTILVFLR